MGNLQKDPLKALSFGLLSSQGARPTPPTMMTPPTPPDLGSALSAKPKSAAPPLGGTFLTSIDEKPRTTGQKTLLGQ